MASELILILDDRAAPPSEIEAVLGKVRFLHIIRRRRRLADELAEAVQSLDGVEISIETITTADEAEALVHRIENRGAGPLYLRLPSCIMPLKMSRLPALLDKSRYALESMILSPIHKDEAVALLTATDAATVLSAETPSARRTQFLRLADQAPNMIDHLELVDLRQPRSLLKFLSGSTEARHFNDLRPDAGVLRKSSTDIPKMRAEHGLFHVAPEALRRFLMPTFDYREDAGRASYAMEHLAIPDAALQFIHGAFDAESYTLFLDQIFAFLAARTADPTGRDVRAAWDSQIVGKLRTRLEAFLDMDEGKKLDAILAASGPMGDLRAMLERAEALLATAARRDTARALVFSHGDPCFSNTLFDRRLGLMRLIDPRGALQAEDAMMHPLYDVAKVSHSALGGYDFINNYMFRCALDETLTLELSLGEAWDGDAPRDASPVPKGPPDWSQEIFRARLAAEGYDIFCVRAVELSLFLSMLPLHADHPRKLAGFALTAAHLISTLEDSLSR